MRYVIFNQKTGRSIEKYPTQRGAKIALAAKIKKAAKMDEKDRPDYAVLSEEDYERDINVMVERTNMMTGKTYMEKLDTPGYCSPSSESYWSM